MHKYPSSALFVVLAVGLLTSSAAQSGGTIEIDETKWISVGVGGRASFKAQEDAAPNGTSFSSKFNLDNLRLYVNGQVHEKIKFEFNTECVFCGNAPQFAPGQAPEERYIVLDAIAKFEFSQYFNIWGGRLLVPADRREMNGPFFSATYDVYRTPFFSQDFSTSYGVGGAGIYGRDNGVTIWGAAGPEGALQYALGVFTGLQSSPGNGPNQADHPLFGARVAYNFLNVEQNPGYYTSGTYYGKAGNILTLAVAVQYQEDGAGSFLNPSDFLGVSVDGLLELPFGNEASAGVLTVDGEYKHFDADYNPAAFTDGTGNFGMFRGDAFTATGLYLLPQKVGWGQFQPYVRYTGIWAKSSSDRKEYEVGVNYVIDGHNARLSLFYQYGDIATKGLNYSPTASGNEVSVIRLGVQIQI